MEPPGQSPAAQTLLGPTGTVGEPEVDAYVQFRLGLPYTGTVFQSGLFLLQGKCTKNTCFWYILEQQDARAQPADGHLRPL